jgi:hypothetical protein
MLATGSTDLVLQIDTDGGLVPPGYLLTHVPQLSLYGDGRFISPGAVDTIYPGPLLPNLQEARLNAGEMQRVAAAADRAGLLGPDASFDVGGIMDAPSTVFTTTVNGVTHRIEAYALGIDAGAAEPGILAARKRLADFRAEIGDLAGFLGRPAEQAQYQPSAVRVFLSSPAVVNQPTVAQELAWPLAVDPASGERTRAEGTRCLAITGNDLATFLDAAKSANAITVWQAPSGKYSASVRPLLPNETGCPAVS